MHNRFTSFNSLSDHSISAAEKRKTPIPLLVNNSIASSGVRGWHLIRSRAANDLLPDHFLAWSHIAVSRAPISQISARVIEIHRLKSFSVDCQ